MAEEEESEADSRAQSTALPTLRGHTLTVLAKWAPSSGGQAAVVLQIVDSLALIGLMIQNGDHIKHRQTKKKTKKKSLTIDNRRGRREPVQRLSW